MIAWSDLSYCRFALQHPAERHPCAVPEVRPFRTDAERDAWVAQNPNRREAVGKRNDHVKAYRQRMEQEARHERDRERLREQAYTAWMWESP